MSLQEFLYSEIVCKHYQSHSENLKIMVHSRNCYYFSFLGHTLSLPFFRIWVFNLDQQSLNEILPLRTRYLFPQLSTRQTGVSSLIGLPRELALPWITIVACHSFSPTKHQLQSSLQSMGTQVNFWLNTEGQQRCWRVPWWISFAGQCLRWVIWTAQVSLFEISLPVTTCLHLTIYLLWNLT